MVSTLRCSSILTGLAFFLLVAFVFPAASQDMSKGWTPEVMIKFKRVGGTAISPDGKRIAYTVSTPLKEGEKSEFLTHIWLVSDDGKLNYQFTYGDTSCSIPAFSPDGKYLAFISSRGASGKNQVWAIRMTGGEAERVTNAKAGVNSYAWSPDSKRIAYTMNDAETEAEEKAKKERRDMVVEDADLKYAHLYTVPLEKDSKGERKTSRLTGGNFHITSFDWSPDGRVIVFAHQATPSVDVWPTTDISTVPSDSGAVNPLVTWKGSDTSPRYSPDGKWIVFASDKGDTKWARAYDLYVIPSGGGEPRKLAETPDRSFATLAWTEDAKAIYVSEADRTVNRVLAVPVDGSKPQIVTPGEGNYSGVSFSLRGSVMSFIHQTSQAPPDVFVTNLTKFEPRKITEVNADYPKLAMGKTELIRWKSKDGKEIEGLLTYPVRYQKGTKCPLILNVHGGPAGVFTQTYTGAGSIYPIQAFAHKDTQSCSRIPGEAAAMVLHSVGPTSVTGVLGIMRTTWLVWTR